MNKNVMKRLAKYLKKDIPLLILTIILAIASTVLILYLPLLTGNAIDCIVGENNVDFTKLDQILKTILIVICATGIIQWIMMNTNNIVTYKVTKRLRKDAFAKIQVLPLKYLDVRPYGEVVNNVITDVDQFADGLLLGLTQAFTGFATIIGTIIFMMIKNWMIALVVIIITPLSLFVAKFIAQSTYKMFKKQSEIRGEQTALIDEMIGNLKVIQAFNYEDRSMARFDEINNELEKCSFRAIFFSSLTNPCTRFVNSIVYALVALFGALICINAIMPGMTMAVGTLSAFLSYATQYTKPFNEISSVITELQNAFACAGRIFDLLDEESEVSDANGIELEDLKGNVDIKNVYFSYVPSQKLIQNFNLHVDAGKRIAIVGPTGCGKTTLINLLMRFYDVNEGEILVDNVNIKDLKRHFLRYNYGMVLQDTWIKTATVKENIALCNPDASMDEIINACKEAHCHNFIMRLKDGYDTIITDEGNMSTGQKQLLCIARIMLCKPPMLILDEATSSIDTRTELKIQEAFNKLMKGKTTFIVAHRLSTIKEADIILVMNNGNIIETGNHEELLKQDGFYAKLYNSQFVKS